MGITKSPSKRLSFHELCRQQYQKAVLIAAIGGAVAAAAFTPCHLDKELMHTCQLTGQDWIKELLEGIYIVLY